MPLTETAITTAEPKNKPYKLADERGLYLLVKQAGKYWRFDYRFAGKRKTISFGVYPTVSLEAARASLEDAHSLLANRVDPSEHRKAEKKEQWDRADHDPLPLRFDLAESGALIIETDTVRLRLNPAQTIALRAFLDATQAEHKEEPPSC